MKLEKAIIVGDINQEIYENLSYVGAIDLMEYSIQLIHKMVATGFLKVFGDDYEVFEEKYNNAMRLNNRVISKFCDKLDGGIRLYIDEDTQISKEDFYNSLNYLVNATVYSLDGPLLSHFIPYKHELEGERGRNYLSCFIECIADCGSLDIEEEKDAFLEDLELSLNVEVFRDNLLAMKNGAMLNVRDVVSGYIDFEPKAEINHSDAEPVKDLAKLDVDGKTAGAGSAGSL